jgi:hypothetical protein
MPAFSISAERLAHGNRGQRKSPARTGGSGCRPKRLRAGRTFPVMQAMRVLPLTLMLALVTSLWSAEMAPLPPRLEREMGEIIIEYSAGDEAYVDAFAAAFPNRPREQQTSATESQMRSVTMLEQRRAEFLQYLAAQLAMKEPSGKMAEGYDNFTRLFRTLQMTDTGAPKRYALWRKPELIARLKRGETIPSFKLAEADQVEFVFNFEVSGVTEESDENLAQKWRGIWDQITMPVPIAKNSDSTPAADIAAALKEHDEMLAAIRQMRMMENVSPFLVLHEATEMAIVDRHITSADRRWFCDGVANYVAFKALEKQFGSEVAKRYYDLDAELTKFASERPHIDLEKWPAAENEKKVGYAKKLSTANYAYATKVIADVCAKHGDDILPKLFAQIARTPKEKTKIKTVYKAFRKLTREDLRDYLPKRAKTKRA